MVTALLENEGNTQPYHSSPLKITYLKLRLRYQKIYANYLIERG